MSKKNRNDNSKAPAAAAPSRLADYFWANLIFFAFLRPALHRGLAELPGPSDDPAVKLVMAETFKFMIFLFGGGFLAVTLFDAAYDFFAEKAEAADGGQ